MQHAQLAFPGDIMFSTYCVHKDIVGNDFEGTYIL